MEYFENEVIEWNVSKIIWSKGGYNSKIKNWPSKKI